MDYVECSVVSRSGTKVTIQTPIGQQEINLGHFSSRFTYLGVVDAATGERKSGGYMKLATGMNLGMRMSRKQSKCDHIFLVWETPWRFSVAQSEGPARFQLCPKCMLSVGVRLE